MIIVMEVKYYSLNLVKNLLKLFETIEKGIIAHNFIIRSRRLNYEKISYYYYYCYFYSLNNFIPTNNQAYFLFGEGTLSTIC